MKELAPAALGAEVEEADLAKVIELWTGIPASRIQENELKKLADLESVLNTKICLLYTSWSMERSTLIPQ